MTAISPRSLISTALVNSRHDVRRDKRVQVHHGTTVLPQKGAYSTVTQSDELPTICPWLVNLIGATAYVPRQPS